MAVNGETKLAVLMLMGVYAEWTRPFEAISGDVRQH
jgi:hypothetical protein